MNRSLTKFTALFLTAMYVAQPAIALAARYQYGPHRNALTLTAYGRTGKTIALSDGRSITVSPQGMATVYDTNHHVTARHWIPSSSLPISRPGTRNYAIEASDLATRVDHMIRQQPYAPGRVLVVFKGGTTAPLDDLRIADATVQSIRSVSDARSRHAMAPRYTTDYATNGALVDLGATRVHRLFSTMDRATLGAMRSTAQARTRHAVLDIANAFVVQMSAASVVKTVETLRKLPSVAYVSPDFAVEPLVEGGHPVDMDDLKRHTENIANTLAARRRLSSVTGTTIPPNLSLASSFQSLLDASGINDVAAYSEIEGQFHQLPGTGEIVTNVSIGDMFDSQDAAALASTPQNECPFDQHTIFGDGPTMHLIGNQRYMDWPGFPLIAAYAADSNGRTDPSYVNCTESDLGEVGLDFTMMSGLPLDQQRTGETTPPGSVVDFLGVAPGATYRLFVPASNAPDGMGGNFLSDLDGVFLAAASQLPQTNVISASLGVGDDVFGFPGRYLEDDPLTQAVITSIVNAKGIVVCISAGDGTRPFTQVAIGPSGGSTPTNTTTDPTAVTNLNDLQFSSAPSLDMDSGAIAVGAVTLNDVQSRNPFDPANSAYLSQLAYPLTRYNGEQLISSSFGSRVNISAPGDNVNAFDRAIHIANSSFDTTELVQAEAGTSASAPETAGAVAVVLQVARLTNHPFASPQAVRQFLIQNAIPLVQPAQTDQPLNVGPELNVGRSVEQLMTSAGIVLKPQAQRVSVAQRRELAPLIGGDSLFTTATDPGRISLDGELDATNVNFDGSGIRDWITIAPDWQALPAGTTFSLRAAGQSTVIATTPFARLQPATILAGAGLPLVSTGSRNVTLIYTALQGHHSVAQATFQLTIGPTTGMSESVPAPIVPPLVTGSTFQVSYDVSSVVNFPNPVLLVTEPGRFNENFPVLHALYEVPLTSPKGTVTVPVSALQGTGLYGVAIACLGTSPATRGQLFSPFEIFRLADTATTMRANAPTLKAHGDIGPGRHTVAFPFGSDVDISWDATNVPGATSALLEISAPGPGLSGLGNTFNNPNGSIVDNNGSDTGSIKTVPLPGLSGTITMNADKDLGLKDGMVHQLRVLPLNGTSAAGEASDVSTIEEFGQQSSIDGLIQQDTAELGGFGVNPNGTDGVLVSTLPLGDGTFENVVDFFDQSSHIATPSDFLKGTLGPWRFDTGGYFGAGTASNTAFVNQAGTIRFTGNFYQFVGPGILPNDLIFQTQFTLPTATTNVLQVSYNPTDATGAALILDSSNLVLNKIQLVPLDPVHHRFSHLPFKTNITSSDLRGNFNPSSFLFNADMSLSPSEALIVRNNGSTFYDTINLATGAITTTASALTISNPVNGSFPMGNSLPIDESTHKAFFTSQQAFSVVSFDLTRNQESEFTLPLPAALLQAAEADTLDNNFQSLNPSYLAVDPVNNLLLAYAEGSNQFFSFDINATPALYVMDELGNLKETINGFGFPQSADPSTAPSETSTNLQVNGALRKAYLAIGNNLQIISY